MKILVFSFFHSYTDYMVECTRRVEPDAVIHLGDYYADADVFCREFPGVALYAVPGNCDRYRGGYQPDPVAVVELDGIRFLLTHGHLYGAKTGYSRLEAAGLRCGADVVCFGHTHRAVDLQEPGRLRLFNPGTIGGPHGQRTTYGVIHVKGGTFTAEIKDTDTL